MQLLAPALEMPLRAELAKHMLQLDPLGSGNAERARDLAFADLAGTRADEREKFGFARKTASCLAGWFGQWIRRIGPARSAWAQSAAFRLRTSLGRDAAPGAAALASGRDLLVPRAFC